MDSRASSSSLLSRGDSEMGSHYTMESGVYMSSFAATIFVASLVTIGILMLTLLIALSVMLESCQSNSSAFFEQVQLNEQYAYCISFAFHAELNNLEEHEYPTICRKHQIAYINEGQYLKDLNFTLNLAESYFDTLRPDDDGLDVILMDIDDIFLSNISYGCNSTSNWSKQVQDMKHQCTMLVLRLLLQLRASGWSLRFVTRNSERELDATIPCFGLNTLGECSSMIIRTYDEVLLESWDYIARRRMQLHNQGFRIVSTISCRLDAFQGSLVGKRNFKLACPSYHLLKSTAKG